MFEDKDVSGLESKAVPAQGRKQQVGERVAGVDFVCEWDRNQVKFIGRRLGFLSPLRG
ncbi:MAG TPA: hypothetical protein VJ999_07435 [Candidatus Sulfotelmatobacter sp.]|nr:hypothetical protein [Candidatus Sulfotelmatobacter sp.]